MCNHASSQRMEIERSAALFVPLCFPFSPLGATSTYAQRGEVNGVRSPGHIRPRSNNIL